MNKREYFCSLLFFLFLISSCVPVTTATKKDSFTANLTRREKAYLKKTTVHSKSGYDLTSGRLGLLALTCNISETGSVVSDTIGHNLLDTDLRILERTYLNKILEEQQITLSGITENIDYTRIGTIANVDYLLVGAVTFAERLYTTGWGTLSSYTQCLGATARIIDVASGEIIMSVVYDTSGLYKTWHNPTLVGEALATGIKYGLWKQSKKEPTQ